jgi:uncharacterized protein (TIGR02145 family)
MAENLNLGTMITSTTGGQLQTNNGTFEKYCYNNTLSFCETYGGLYEWNEAMQYVTAEGAQGICPAGWHIPADNEFKILEGAVDSQYPVGDPEWDLLGWRGLDAGSNLKEEGTAHWMPPNLGATNEYGFTSLPGGHRYYNFGEFINLGYDCYFWTSSQIETNEAWTHRPTYFYTTMYRSTYHKSDGFSIRCIKND